MRSAPLVVAILAILLSIPTTTLGQQETTGGFLFSYRPHPGEHGAFEEGYRRHLDWHREKADSLAWYGWSVLAGPRLEQFVDGAFGMPFAAIDARVDPAGDAADGAETYRPHGTPTGRTLLLLRPDLSSATPLEDLDPAPFVQVVHYSVGPGDMGRLERAFDAMQRASRRSSLLRYTVYEVVAGGELGFLLMVCRDGMSSFDDVERNPEHALRTHIAGEGGGQSEQDEPLRIDMTNELWRYRPDLSYLGPEETK